MSPADVIVLDIDGGEALGRCLEAVAAQTVRPSRVIVFDNGSRVPAESRTGSCDLAPLVVRSDANLGFAGGINEAMKRVESPFVAWINNDVELRSTWLERMLLRIRERDRLAAVQSVILREDGRIDGAGIAIADGRFTQRLHGLEAGAAHAGAPPLWGISATAALFRVEALEDVAFGGTILHPAFFAWYEDVELAARFAGRAWEVALVDEPLAIHRGSMSAGALGGRAEWLRVRNRHWVRRLHPGVGRLGALLAEDAIELGRAIANENWGRAWRIPPAVVSGLLSRIE